VGRDAAGDALVAAWEALGASSQRVARIGDGGTPVVSMILDSGGEVRFYHKLQPAASSLPLRSGQPTASPSQP